MTKVTIETQSVGQSFATIGVVRRNGRIVYRGPERPYGFVESALEDCREWAGDHFCRIVEKEN